MTGPTLRVGYVLKAYPRLSQTFVVHELRAHERAGLPVTIFALRPPKPEDRDVVVPPLAAEVVLLPGPEPELAAQLAEAARARGVTHLHAHFAKLATGVARAAAGRLGVPYSFTAHARDIYERTVEPGVLAERIRDAAQVVTVSRFNADHLEQRFGRRPAVVYNGVPIEAFPFVPPADSVEAPLVLGVGRLVAKKGFHVLLDACRRLVADNVAFRCELIGEGPERAALTDRIAALGLASHVRLLGARPPADVLAHMRTATLLAVPSVVAADGDRDGLPSVLLEAMALGLPCVGTDVTGIPEAITDGETGLLVLQNDAGALARAIRDLLADRALRGRLATAARAHVERRFSSAANTRRLRALWGAAPLRVLFRIYNRRGLGHWMRALNVARELLALESATEIRFFTRSAPPFPVDDPRIRTVRAADPEAMDVLPDELAAFAPDVIVDDTMPPSQLTTGGARHVFVMRRSASPRQEQVLANPVVAAMDAVIVPHTCAEFGHALPEALVAKTTFVGPIVRRAAPAATAALRARLALDGAGFVLVSTPGGGGFEEDGARFAEVVRRVHGALRQCLPGLRHVFVQGPNATRAVEPVDPVDPAMTVLASEPEMASLIACADVVLSAGGYNSVSEIRLAKRPAFFLPGRRPHDDQLERVEALARAGLAVVVDDADPDRAAARIADGCLDSAALARMRESYVNDLFEPGNVAAARGILTCARR